MFEKQKLNFVIDSLMFLCLSMLAGIGFLMKYVLVPGHEKHALYGKGVDLYYLGLDHHQWGTVHLTIAYVMIGLLALHIILHWNMIPGMFRKIISDPFKRKITAVVFLALCAVIISFSFCAEPKVKDSGRRGSGRDRDSQPVVEHEAGLHPETRVDSGEHEHGDAEGGIEVRGFMTLEEVSAEYNVPADYLKKSLGLPAGTSPAEKLGHLRRAYGFSMSDVEKAIVEYND